MVQYINWLIKINRNRSKYDYEAEQKNRALVVVINLRKKNYLKQYWEEDDSGGPDIQTYQWKQLENCWWKNSWPKNKHTIIKWEFPTKETWRVLGGKRTPKEELPKLELSLEVKWFVEWLLKQKRKPPIKKIDLQKILKKQSLGYLVLTKILSKIF